MDKRFQQTVGMKKIIGILFFILIIGIILISAETPNSVAIGDIILRKIGLKSWSNGTQGFHYMLIYSLILLIIGYKGVIYFLQDFYPGFTKKLPVILIVLLVFQPSIYSAINKTIKTFSNGINSVEYSMETSGCDYKIDNDGNVVLNGNLQFKNYSNKEVKFYIKLLPRKIDMDNIINEESVTATSAETNAPQEFILEPKSSENFQVFFKTTSKKRREISQGRMQNLNVIIFSKDKEIQFVKW